MEEEDWTITGNTKITLNWLKMPAFTTCTEVTDLIFSYLDKKFLLSCRKVSRSYRTTAPQ